MCWTQLRLLAALAPLPGAGVAGASAMNMRVFEINEHLLSFYDGRPAETETPAGKQDWADVGAMNVGAVSKAYKDRPLPDLSARR